MPRTEACAAYAAGKPCRLHHRVAAPPSTDTGGHTCGERDSHRYHKTCLHRASETCGQVLNWMQTKLHGSQRGRRRSAEFSAGTARPADASGGLPQTDKLNNGWTTAMLSIGTFGMREEGKRVRSRGRLDELAGARRAATAGELGRVNHLQPERLLSCSNGGIGRPRSFRALATRAFGGFRPRPSLRETVPEMRFDEIVWSLLLKKAHPENPAFSDTATRDDQVVKMAPKGEVQAEDEGGKWIRTDSQYIVLEI